jgi:hypothetical protein
MSFTKRLIEKQEEQRRVAGGIAIASGILKVCELHDYVYDSGELDRSRAYAFGNARFSKGEFSEVFDDRKEMTDAIKSAIEDSPEEC